MQVPGPDLEPKLPSKSDPEPKKIVPDPQHCVLFILDSLMTRPVNDEEPVGVRAVAVAAVSPQQRNVYLPGPALHVLRRTRLIQSQL
jgi:hypothetical protein